MHGKADISQNGDRRTAVPAWAKSPLESRGARAFTYEWVPSVQSGSVAFAVGHG